MAEALLQLCQLLMFAHSAESHCSAYPCVFTATTTAAVIRRISNTTYNFTSACREKLQKRTHAAALKPSLALS